MLPEFLEQDHREQVRPRPAARRDVEGRRRLAHLLAIAAGKLLPHMLDHLPLTGDHFQRFGHLFAQLAQPGATAALAGGRHRFDHPLPRQMRWEGLARRPLADEGGDIRGPRGGQLGRDLVFGRGALQLLEAELHLIEQLYGALRALAMERTPQLGDLQLLVRDDGLVIRGFGAGHGEFRFDTQRPRRRGMQCRLQRVDIVVLRIAGHAGIESQMPPVSLLEIDAQPAARGRNVARGFRQSMPSSM